MSRRQKTRRCGCGDRVPTAGADKYAHDMCPKRTEITPQEKAKKAFEQIQRMRWINQQLKKMGISK